MNILCVEDERVIARYIESLVKEVLTDSDYTFKHVEDIEDAESMLLEKSIDLLLLDLNLHGRNGFELLSHSVSCTFNTIIISANTDQAIKAFEYGVIDFVSKPFNKERLQQAFSRVEQKRTAGNGARYLCVKKASQLIRVEVEKIHHIEGAGSYSELHLYDGSILLHDKNLERLLEVLPASFVRIHKSYLVDLSDIVSIKSYPGSKYEAKLTDGVVLPISRQRVARIKQRLSDT